MKRSFIPSCILDSHLYSVPNTRCRLGTVFSPDDGHIVTRNMYRKAINILRKLVHQFGSVYKDYTRMHGQQNIKLCLKPLYILTPWSRVLLEKLTSKLCS
jgi:hypothetical protein